MTYGPISILRACQLAWTGMADSSFVTATRTSSMPIVRSPAACASDAPSGSQRTLCSASSPVSSRISRRCPARVSVPWAIPPTVYESTWIMFPPKRALKRAPSDGKGQQASVPSIVVRWSHRPRDAGARSALAGAVHARAGGPGGPEQGAHEDPGIGPALVGQDGDRDVLVRQPAHGRA